MIKTESGFTLLEVLIAILILSIMTISIINITTDSQNTAERIVTEDRTSLEIETAFARLEWDISQLFSPLYYQEELSTKHFLTGDEELDELNAGVFNDIMSNYSGNNNFSFPASDLTPVPKNDLPTKEELIIFTTSNRRKIKNQKQSHFMWVRYVVGDDPLMSEDDTKEYSGKALLRYQKTHDPFNEDIIVWDQIKPQVLLRNVHKVEFSLYNHDKKKFEENIAVIVYGRELIRGVKVKLTWVNEDDNPEEYEKIFRPLYPYVNPELFKTEERNIRQGNNEKGNNPEGRDR